MTDFDPPPSFPSFEGPSFSPSPEVGGLPPDFAAPAAAAAAASGSSSDAPVVAAASGERSGEGDQISQVPQQRKLVYYVPDQQISRARRIELVFFILFLVLLIIVLVLCIVFLTPQTPYDLGPTLCCSPKRMYLGQRLNNRIWYLKLDTGGTLTLYKDDPMATPALTQVWSTDTADENVDYALLDTTGTLQLVNTNGGVVWTTPPPDLTQVIVPVAPYRMTLDENGVVTILSANNIPVWVREPYAVALQGSGKGLDKGT